MRTLALATLAFTSVAVAYSAWEIGKHPSESRFGAISALYHAGQLWGRVGDKLTSTAFPNVGSDWWVIEDPIARSQLPPYFTISAASPEELTPSNGLPYDEAYVNWHRSHGNHGATRYSLLDQINTGNVKDLEVAWIYRSRDGARAIQSNPVIADGLVFVPTAGHAVVAIDAASGTEVWRYQTRGWDPAKRGLVWWPGTESVAPRVYFSAGNALIALDARTGKPIPDFGKDGLVMGWASRTPPAIFGSTILQATLKPSVEAYDLITGKPKWKRDLIEENMNQRQGGRSFRLSRGYPWGGNSLDDARGIFYVTTGNPGPEHVGTLRPGANEHSCSVIAYDVRSGKRLWVFQDVSHDLWDLDIGAPPILTSIVREGRRIDVVAVPTKLGNTLLLDRVTGKPVFDFRLRRAPTSSLPGERTAPYQPDVQLPQPFSRQAFTPDDVTNIGVANRESVLEQIKGMDFGFFRPPRENVRLVYFGAHGGADWPGGAVDARTGILYVTSNHIPWTLLVLNEQTIDESRYPSSDGRVAYLRHCASCHGSNREGLQGARLVGIGSKLTAEKIMAIVTNGQKSMPPIQGLSHEVLKGIANYLISADKELGRPPAPNAIADRFQYFYSERRRLLDLEGYPGSAPPWGTLNALNLNTGKIIWTVPLGEYALLTRRGLPITGMENFGGPIVTAGGLVFVGGTPDKKIRAFDKATGKELWSFELPFGGYAPPATYAIGGRQYVVIPASGGGVLSTEAGDALVAFALPRAEDGANRRR